MTAEELVQVSIKRILEIAYNKGGLPEKIHVLELLRIEISKIAIESERK